MVATHYFMIDEILEVLGESKEHQVDSKPSGGQSSYKIIGKKTNPSIKLLKINTIILALYE